MKKASKDFTTRLAAAKQFRNHERPYIEEVLMYCCPGREYDFARSKKNQTVDENQTYISIPEEMAMDFASDLVTYYTPSEAKWLNYEVTIPVPEDQADAILELVKDREDQFFEVLNSSNYNDISPQVMFEAAHGTIAMWCEAGHLSLPVHFEAVPPHELYITPGFMGILDRFREKMVDCQTLEALFDGYEVDLSDPKLVAKRQKAGSTCKVIWGFWVDWSDPGNPLWRMEITVDDQRVTPEQPVVLGPLAGTCPLLVGRFNPQIGKPWGRGPGRKALPDLRVLDKIEEIVLNGLDQSILNTIIYPDDGFLDLSDGIEPGRSYAANRGFTRDQIYEMSKGVNLDYGFFSEERIEDRIRAAFYQDGPRQRGETPPTASQWLDERRRTQQRLGKPSSPLWSEFFLPLVQRVEHLAVQLGRMDEAISHRGEAIAISPVSPLQKAQNQDEVNVARSNLDLAYAVFPDGVPVDRMKTFQNIVETSGDRLTVVAEPQVMDEGTPPPA